MLNLTKLIHTYCFSLALIFMIFIIVMLFIIFGYKWLCKRPKFKILSFSLVVAIMFLIAIPTSIRYFLVTLDIATDYKTIVFYPFIAIFFKYVRDLILEKGVNYYSLLVTFLLVIIFSVIIKECDLTFLYVLLFISLDIIQDINFLIKNISIFVEHKSGGHVFLHNGEGTPEYQGKGKGRKLDTPGVGSPTDHDSKIDKGTNNSSSGASKSKSTYSTSKRIGNDLDDDYYKRLREALDKSIETNRLEEKKRKASEALEVSSDPLKKARIDHILIGSSKTKLEGSQVELSQTISTQSNTEYKINRLAESNSSSPTSISSDSSLDPDLSAKEVKAYLITRVGGLPVPKRVEIYETLTLNGKNLQASAENTLLYDKALGSYNKSQDKVEQAMEIYKLNNSKENDRLLNIAKNDRDLKFDDLKAAKSLIKNDKDLDQCLSKNSESPIFHQEFNKLKTERKEIRNKEIK